MTPDPEQQVAAVKAALSEAGFAAEVRWNAEHGAPEVNLATAHQAGIWKASVVTERFRQRPARCWPCFTANAEECPHDWRDEPQPSLAEVTP